MDRSLPVYDENTQSWKVKSNNMHMAPRFGPAGLGNPFNTYTWSMATYFNGLLALLTRLKAVLRQFSDE